MTATEKARRAESLYQDRAKRELADMVVHREADLEDAKAESEHMRLKALAVTGKLQEENERLKADNAKLREVVRLMWKPFCWAQSYGACLTDEQDAEIRDKVRELGVVE